MSKDNNNDPECLCDICKEERKEKYCNGKCCEQAKNNIWYDNDEFIYDTDNGLRGEEIYFCPWCGKKLKLEV